MKSKVCSIANRLAKTMSLSAAFTQAWSIVKSGSVAVKVAGVSFGSRQTALRRLELYRPSQIVAFLAPEPENPVDKNAVAVMVAVQGGKGLYKLGYVPAKDTAVVKALRAKSPKVEVLPGTTYGARLRIAV